MQNEHSFNEMDESIFLNKNINGGTFLKIILEESYTVIFANIKAYVYPIKYSSIENYDEFVKSECQLVILCTDVFYYEIYAKNIFMIEVLNNNAKENNFYDVEYITDENDGRTSFSVI